MNARTIERTVTETIRVETLVLAAAEGADLVLYRTTTTRRVGSRRPSKPTIREGIACSSVVERWTGGNALPAATSRRGEWQSGYLAVRPQYLEVLRTWGWGAAHDDDPSRDTYRHVIEKPFTACERGEDCIVIEACGATHEAFDLLGNPYPVALHFNYIDGSFSNHTYDLARVVAVLGQRDDVRLLPATEGRLVKGGVIDRIPGYNADADRQYCVTFVWMPTPEDAARVHAVATTPNDLRRVCFDLDIFGLRKAGAARFNDYWSTEPTCVSTPA